MVDHKQTLTKIRGQVKCWIKKVDDERDIHFGRCIMLLAAASFVTGVNVDQLAAYTGYPKDFVERVAERMKATGLWDENFIAGERWFGEDGRLTADIIEYALVAIGEVKCKRNKAGIIEFYNPGTGESWEEVMGPVRLFNALNRGDGEIIQ